MGYLKDKVSLYSDKGQLLVADVPLEAVSPIHNPVAQRIKDTITRTIAVNLEKAEYKLKTGHFGDEYIHIMPMPWAQTDQFDLVNNADKIAKRVKDLLQVDPDDDTEVKVIRGGRYLLVRPPKKLLGAGVEYSSAMTNSAFAVSQAIYQEFKEQGRVSWLTIPYIHAAIYGRYTQTVGYDGGTLQSMLAFPHENEGPGYAMRNMMVNHTVMITRKRTLEAVALNSFMEHTALFDMGEMLGPWRRHHLLVLAYQGLNANNLTYETVKANGKGTTNSVVASIVERMVNDNVIVQKEELPSGYKVFTPTDPSLYHAYAAAGMLSAVIVNQGAARASQGVMSSVYYYNDFLENELGIPGVDFGDCMGEAMASGFFSHTIYGGSAPGLFHGNHVVTKVPRGTYIPCLVAATCLDAGTQTFGPELTSEFIGDVYSEIEELRRPMEAIAEGAKQVKDRFK